MAWTITHAATEDYLRILGRPRSLTARYQAQDELRDLAEQAARKGPPRLLGDGRAQYRGPGPLRLRLIVSVDKVVQVLPDHDGRRQPYTKSERSPAYRRRQSRRCLPRRPSVEAALQAIEDMHAEVLAETQADLAEIAELVRSARTALEHGDKAEAARLLTTAADLEFDLTGTADTIGVLQDALGLKDGAEARLAQKTRRSGG